MARLGEPESVQPMQGAVVGVEALDVDGGEEVFEEAGQPKGLLGKGHWIPLH